MAKRRERVVAILAILTICAAASAHQDSWYHRVLQRGTGFFEDISPEDSTIAPAMAALHDDSEQMRFLDTYPRKPFKGKDCAPCLPEFPKADYGSETVIVIALGNGRSENSYLSLDSLDKRKDSVLVFATERLMCPSLSHGWRTNSSIILALEGANLKVWFAPLQVAQDECE